jgi:hypothetical protein
MSVITIKLEMAELSLKANRIEEAEKTIMDVILDPSTDSDSQYSAFLALGSIKMIKLLKNTAIFSEVEYCIKKAYAIKSNELTVDAYIVMLSYFLKTATTAIDTSKENIKKLQRKAGIDFLVTIGSAYVLNQRGNSVLTNVIGIIGLDYGINGIIGDIKTIDGYENLIKYLNNAINEVVGAYNQSGFFNEGQIQYFKGLLYETGIGTNSLSSSDKNKVELFLGILEDASKDKVEIDVKVSDSIKGLIKLSNDFNVSCSKIHNKIGDDEQKYCYHFQFIYKSNDLRVLFTNKYVYVIILSGIFIKKVESLVKLEYTDFNSDNLKIQTNISNETKYEIGQKIVYEVSSELSYTLLSIGNTDSRAELGGVYLDKLYNALISAN